jgi:pyridoxamine 5'-phosphate oxidase
MPSLVGSPLGFDPGEAPDEPRSLFLDWLAAAVDAGVPEPHAAVLSTIGEDGVPDARVLILRNVTEDGRWCFASGEESVKGRQLESAPVAALTFYWGQLVRSVRLRGRVERSGADDAARDFLARSPDSRAAALAGAQSTPVGSRAEVEAAIAAQSERARDDTVVADGWAVWGLRPDSIEFWEGSSDRAHIRLRYERAGSSWTRGLLWP